MATKLIPVQILASLLKEFQARLEEYQHATLERRRELQHDLEQTATAINKTHEGLASYASVLFAQGFKPLVEESNGGSCRFKNIRLHSRLFIEIKKAGFGICPECKSINLSSVRNRKFLP